MSENTLKAKILQLAGPAVGAQNLEIWGLEVIEAGRMLVRLYVDMPGKAEEEAPAETEGGDIPENISATVDQCESISRQLALALDAEEVIDRPYTLEVSTPGLDRLFFSADQMKDYTGEIIDARYPEAITRRSGEAAPRVARHPFRGRRRFFRPAARKRLRRRHVSPRGLPACDAPLLLRTQGPPRLHLCPPSEARPGQPSRQGQKEQLF